MISELYDALKEAGASEEKARRAAEALASYDAQFAAVRQDIAGVRSEVRLLIWMVGGIYAILVLIGVPAVWLLVRTAAKVGALPI